KLVHRGIETKELKGDGYAVFSQSPFYAESGGQVGDKGTVSSGGMKARVQSTFKVGKHPVLQLKIEEGLMKSGETVRLEVDSLLRRLTMRNHTATHLLHAALRKELGERVKQAGSLVDPDRLRFDFTYPKALQQAELKRIESLVNEQVLKNSKVSVAEMPYDEAIKKGALAFFDEKYGSHVRVVRVGEEGSAFSVELCGGTHLSEISEIGYFKILSESSVASGIRRIEAVTSVKAFEYLTSRESLFSEVEGKLGMKDGSAVEKLDSVLSQIKNLQKETEQLKIKLVQGGTSGRSESAAPVEIKGVKLISEQVDESDPKILRALVDKFRDQGKEKTLVLLLGTGDGKVSLCVGLTKDLIGKLDAGKIVQLLAPEIGGKGGGRSDFAQAGGNNPSGIPQTVSKLKSWLESQL
ncbi:alanine--tRNA ligase, partial [bacterium]|nr:alanine--tRNA ligase [bacterium]